MNSVKNVLILAFVLLITWNISAQNICNIDANITPVKMHSGHLKMGNPGPAGKEILINNKYMALGDKPIIPVMGEMHYSRIPKAQWEDVILKMKACGITIVAAYVLWIHHEEVEGQFDWTGNKDLRAFVKLCAKHDMYVYPRIGPWCHAEVRNGGTPDWILTKTNLKDRSNDPVYQHYAEAWYQQIALQLKGLFYKDGGPIIGVQLENEYRLGKSGEDHILWLKKTALKYGIDVPLYTVTGWQNGSVPPYEVVPLWGAYPDEPWADNLNKGTDCSNFRFTPFRDNENIGNDVKKSREQYIDYSSYPYFTCEVGVGIENTEHRRLQISPIDGLGLMIAKIGSGSNLAGYYMFAGGSNPHGELTSLEENKDETGYWNTNPVISYDFQAAIRESGKLNDCYYEVKKLHYFLNEFGNILAPMDPVPIPQQEGLQYAVRVKENSAFIFGLNYCRHNKTDEKKNLQFKIKLKDETLLIPSKPLNVEDSALFIWPVNFKLGNNVQLTYATAQPLCNINDKWVFIQNLNSEPEFCFDSAMIKEISSSSGKVIKKDGRYIVTGLQPGMHSSITLLDKNNKKQHIVLLSKQEAKHAWLFNDHNKKYFFVSNANISMEGKKLHVTSTLNNIKIDILNDNQNSKDNFTSCTYTIPKKQLNIPFEMVKPLDDALWLKISAVDSLTNRNVLMHRFFVKEFSLGNPSKIKKASLIIAPQAECRLQINNTWVNRSIVVDSMNEVDVTGYVQKGENRIMLDFPFEQGLKAFAAKLVVEYFNADKIEITTDQAWMMKDAYTYPSYLTKEGGYKQPEIIESPKMKNVALKTSSTYSITLPENYLVGLNNLFMNIYYNGDKAKMYFNHRLIADNFNDGSTWSIGLNRLENNIENQKLKLEISPLPVNARVYFDDEKGKKAATAAFLKDIKLIPEYKIDMTIEGNSLNIITPE